jgi:hypothetical protein
MRLSNVAVALTNEADALALAQANVGQSGCISVVKSVQVECTFHLYQNLLLTLSHMLNELPMVDGTDATFPCELLRKFLIIRQIGQI